MLSPLIYPPGGNGQGGNVADKIELLGIDRERVKDSGESREVPFRLSATPSTDWGGLFLKSYDRKRSTMYRKVELQGDRVILKGPISEVAQYHLPQIKRAVAEANEEYGKYLERVAESDQKLTEELAQEKVELDRKVDEIDKLIANDDD